MQTESPVHHSNVMAYSSKEKVRSRIGHKCAALAIRGDWSLLGFCAA